MSTLTKRSRQASPDAQRSGLTWREIRKSIVFWNRQPVIILAHIAILPILIVILWGLREPVRLFTWSVTALVYTAYIGLRGWIPWRMPVYQVATARPTSLQSSNAESDAMAFINAPSRRARAAAITATAALTPWIMYVVTVLLDLRPVGRGAASLPLWGFAVLGLGDAIRASTFALRRWTKDILEHWSELAEQNPA